VLVAQLDVVTGAFGYTGKYIARRLLANGRHVKTLTRRPPSASPFGSAVTVAPLDFERPANLVRALAGVDTLYNTYWIRFERGAATFDRAVANTRVLIAAARDAGVRRIVHLSITNPSPTSPLLYFRGKALVEELIAGSGLSYALLRPTVIFGDEDILINNIAWLLRRFPVFLTPGSGAGRLQPVFVDDMARIAVTAGRAQENLVIDAVGPQVFRFEELVHLIAAAVGSRARVVYVSPALALRATRWIGWVVRDVLLTRDELAGLMENLLVSDGPPTGSTRLADWLGANAPHIGRRYASELKRHFR